MKTEIEPFQIAALVLAGQSPIRETVELHGGAVVIRTVARRENEPDLKAIDRKQIQVSVKFLDRLNAEIQVDKRAIHELKAALQQAIDSHDAIVTSNLPPVVKACFAAKFNAERARAIIAKNTKQTNL